MNKMKEMHSFVKPVPFLTLETKIFLCKSLWYRPSLGRGGALMSLQKLNEGNFIVRKIDEDGNIGMVLSYSCGQNIPRKMKTIRIEERNGYFSFNNCSYLFTNLELLVAHHCSHEMCLSCNLRQLHLPHEVEVAITKQEIDAIIQKNDMTTSYQQVHQPPIQFPHNHNNNDVNNNDYPREEMTQFASTDNSKNINFNNNISQKINLNTNNKTNLNNNKINLNNSNNTNLNNSNNTNLNNNNKTNLNNNNNKTNLNNNSNNKTNLNNNSNNTNFNNNNKTNLNNNKTNLNNNKTNLNNNNNNKTNLNNNSNNTNFNNFYSSDTIYDNMTEESLLIRNMKMNFKKYQLNHIDIISSSSPFLNNSAHINNDDDNVPAFNTDATSNTHSKNAFNLERSHTQLKPPSSYKLPNKGSKLARVLSMGNEDRPNPPVPLIKLQLKNYVPNALNSPKKPSTHGLHNRNNLLSIPEPGNDPSPIYAQPCEDSDDNLKRYLEAVAARQKLFKNSKNNTLNKSIISSERQTGVSNNSTLSVGCRKLGRGLSVSTNYKIPCDVTPSPKFKPPLENVNGNIFFASHENFIASYIGDVVVLGSTEEKENIPVDFEKCENTGGDVGNSDDNDDNTNAANNFKAGDEEEEDDDDGGDDGDDDYMEVLDRCNTHLTLKNENNENMKNNKTTRQAPTKYPNAFQSNAPYDRDHHHQQQQQHHQQYLTINNNNNNNNNNNKDDDDDDDHLSILRRRKVTSRSKINATTSFRTGNNVTQPQQQLTTIINNCSNNNNININNNCSNINNNNINNNSNNNNINNNENINNNNVIVNNNHNTFKNQLTYTYSCPPIINEIDFLTDHYYQHQGLQPNNISNDSNNNNNNNNINSDNNNNSNNNNSNNNNSNNNNSNSSNNNNNNNNSINNNNTKRDIINNNHDNDGYNVMTQSRRNKSIGLVTVAGNAIQFNIKNNDDDDGVNFNNNNLIPNSFFNIKLSNDTNKFSVNNNVNYNNNNNINNNNNNNNNDDITNDEMVEINNDDADYDAYMKVLAEHHPIRNHNNNNFNDNNIHNSNNINSNANNNHNNNDNNINNVNQRLSLKGKELSLEQQNGCRTQHYDVELPVQEKMTRMQQAQLQHKFLQQQSRQQFQQQKFQQRPQVDHNFQQKQFQPRYLLQPQLQQSQHKFQQQQQLSQQQQQQQLPQQSQHHHCSTLQHPSTQRSHLGQPPPACKNVDINSNIIRNNSFAKNNILINNRNNNIVNNNILNNNNNIVYNKKINNHNNSQNNNPNPNPNPIHIGHNYYNVKPSNNNNSNTDNHVITNANNNNNSRKLMHQYSMKESTSNYNSNNNNNTNTSNNNNTTNNNVDYNNLLDITTHNLVLHHITSVDVTDINSHAHHICQGIIRFSTQQSTFFGQMSTKFIQCTLTGKESNPTTVAVHIRQFMDGMKNYLINFGDTNICKIIESERDEMKSEEILNMDSIFERSLLQCILKPLFNHLKLLYKTNFNSCSSNNNNNNDNNINDNKNNNNVGHGVIYSTHNNNNKNIHNNIFSNYNCNISINNKNINIPNNNNNNNNINIPNNNINKNNIFHNNIFHNNIASNNNNNNNTKNDVMTSTNKILSLNEAIRRASDRNIQQLGLNSQMFPSLRTAMNMCKSYFVNMNFTYSPIKKVELLISALMCLENELSNYFLTKTCTEPNHIFMEFTLCVSYAILECNFTTADIEIDYIQNLLQRKLFDGLTLFYFNTFISATDVIKKYWSSDCGVEISNADDESASLRRRLFDEFSNTMEVFAIVYMLDDRTSSLSKWCLPVNCNTNALDICLMMSHQLKLTNLQDYGLYVVTETEEHLLGKAHLIHTSLSSSSSPPRLSTSSSSSPPPSSSTSSSSTAAVLIGNNELKRSLVIKKLNDKYLWSRMKFV